MAITLVGQNSNIGTSSTASVTHGLTISEGDFVIVQIATNGTATPTLGAFTAATGYPYVSGSQYTTIAAKTAGASEPSDYSFTLSASDRWTIIVKVFSAAGALSWDVEPTPSAPNASTSITIPEITTLVDNTMLVAFGASDNSAVTYSALGNGFGDLEQATGGQSAFIATKAQPTAGATGSVGFTQSAAMSVIVGLGSIKEAPAGDGITTSTNKTITIGAAGNNRVVVALVGQSRNPTALSNIQFGGVAGTLAVSSDDGGTISAIYYWLEADLPASAGDYTFTHSFLVNCSLVYAEGIVQAAPNDTKVLADVLTGGTNVTELERYVDLSLASVGDLCVHSAVRAGATDGAISGCTDIEAAVGFPTSYTVTQTTIGHGEDTLPDEFVAASFAAIPTGPITETATTGNIPLVIQAGYTLLDLVDPVTTDSSILFGAVGTPVTGDHSEFKVTSALDDGVTFSVAANGVWTITEAVDGNWTTDIVVSRRVVQQDGTIGTEASITFQAPTQGGGGGGGTPQYNVEHLIQWIKENIEGDSTTAKLKAFLDAEISAGPGVNNQLYEYLKLISSLKDHTERYRTWTSG